MLSFLDGGGELGRLIAKREWRGTPMGPIDTWAPHVRIAIGIILRSPVPIVSLWGPLGVMLYNDAYAGFAGTRHPSLLGAEVRKGWPEVADFNDNVMKVVFHGGGTLTYADQALRLQRGGREEQAFLNLDYSPILDEKARPAAVMAIVVETTSKVRAERHVTGERERLRQMFEQAPGFMAVLSGPQHVFDLVNPAYLQLIGHREVLGQPVREALPEVAGQGFFDLLDQVYAKGEAFSGVSLRTLLQRTAGGVFEPRFLDFVYQPLRNELGTVVGIFVQGTDVTDRVGAEAALRDSEEQFRTFAQAMPNQVWAAKPDGRLDWLNQRVLDYSGEPSERLEGHGWASMVHADEIAAARASWFASLSSGQVYQTEFRLRRNDGAYRWHIGRAVPIRAPDGAIVRWIGTNTDIEEQKAVVQSLAQLNRTLEQRVEEEVARRSVVEEALRQSQKLDSLGQLTGGIAHDFNNMLAGILSAIDLVKRRLASGDMHDVGQILARAESSSKRAAQLTQRLLAFARRQPLDIERVDVGAVLHSLSDMFQRTLGSHVALSTTVAADLWPARTDAAQLESALLNLVINSRDAMPRGGRLSLEAANGSLDASYAARRGEVTAGDYVVVSVSDSGSGMSAETRDKAFDPFFTTKPLGMGTGLGLSMVYGFMQQVGGHASIYSEEGMGTTVRLYLPRDHANETRDAGPKSLLGEMAGKGETILMVEDDADLRELQSMLLHDLGYDYIVSHDAPAAIAVLESPRRIDLLLTDVGLPGMNGRQLAEIARTIRPGIPVVFLTGYAEQAAVRHEFLAADMHLLTKPVAPEALAERLRVVLSAAAGS